MLGFVKKLFGSGDSEPATPTVDPREAVSHEGYRIEPSPRHESAGWRVMGRIVLESDETRVHEFVRADVFSDRDTSVTITVQKGRQIITEQGLGMFRSARAPDADPPARDA